MYFAEKKLKPTSAISENKNSNMYVRTASAQSDSISFQSTERRYGHRTSTLRRKKYIKIKSNKFRNMMQEKVMKRKGESRGEIEKEKEIEIEGNKN